MDEHQRALLALECLRLAQAANPDTPWTPQIIERATAYREFVEGAAGSSRAEDIVRGGKFAPAAPFGLRPINRPETDPEADQ